VKRRDVLQLLLLAIPTIALAASPDTPSSQGSVCIAASAIALQTATCANAPEKTLTVTASKTPRISAWFSGDGAEVALSEIPVDATSLEAAPANSGIAALTFAGDIRRGWPADVTLSVMRDGKEVWRVLLPKKTVAKLRRIRLPAGRFTLAATTPHHVVIERSGLSITRGAQTQLGVLRFRPAVVVTGRFVDSAQTPIAGVALVDADDATVIAIADAAGSLAAELPPRTPASLDIVASGFASHDLTIDPSATEVALGVVTLSRGRTLHVTVDRSAVPQATITAALLARDSQHRDPRVLAKKTLEPPASSFEFPAVEAGYYTLLLSGKSPFERYAEDIRIRDADVAHDIRITPIKVEGEVLIGDDPLGGSLFSLQGPDRAWEEEITLDEHGAFTTNIWQPGTFTGFVYGGKVRSGAFVSDTLTASADPTHWHIVIPNRRIVGRIFDNQTFEPLAEADMDKRFSTPDGGVGSGVVTVDQDGSFSIDAANVADYELTVNARNYLPETIRVTLKAEDTLRRVDFAMERGRLAPLIVTTPAGEPISNAVVIDGLGTDGVNPDHFYLTDAAGRIDLRMKADEAKTLYILPHEGSFVIVDARAPRDDSAPPQRVIVPQAVGDLGIRVVDSEGKPLPYVMPLIRFEGRFLPPPVPRFFPFADPRFSTVATNGEGVVTFKNFPAGVYEVYACRSDAEIVSALRGAPVRDPVRIGFSRSSDATIVLP
jgi:hypothetical protein